MDRYKSGIQSSHLTFVKRAKMGISQKVYLFSCVGVLHGSMSDTFPWVHNPCWMCDKASVDKGYEWLIYSPSICKLANKSLQSEGFIIKTAKTCQLVCVYMVLHVCERSCVLRSVL